jgi:RNA polymerase sigma-70 factor (ECF subfamily)
VNDSAELDHIRRAQAGDPRAFELLVDEYQGVLYHLALRMTGNSEDARDLTQNVFLKVWRNLGRYDASYRFYSWIYRIALNESLNFVQRRKRHDELDERIPADTPTPAAGAQAADRERLIQEAMQDLTPEYRQVIVLRHFQNLSYEEIAQMIGIPEKTVKSRLFTARQRLGVALTRRGVTG